MVWHVVEVCGGAGGISSAADHAGLRAGPVVELKGGLVFLDTTTSLWLLWACLAGRIWMLVWEPPPVHYLQLGPAP